MKKIFTRFAGILLAAAIVIGCLPAATAQAATYDEVTQTAATKNTVTIAWPEQEGAVVYQLEYTIKQSINTNLSDKITVTTTDTTYKFTDLPNNSYLSVAVKGYASEEDLGTYKYIDYDSGTLFKTRPTKVTGLKYFSNFNQSHRTLSVSFTASDPVEYLADGYIAELYDYTGKKIQTVFAGRYSSFVEFTKATITNSYKVKITPYITINEKRVRGTASAWFYAVPSPKLIKKDTYVKAKSMKVRFVPVKGATKYVIYGAQRTKSTYTMSDISWKKVATLSAAKAKSLGNIYTIKTIGTKAVDTKKYYVYATVVAYSKYGTKIAHSAKTAYIYGHTY